MTTCTVREHVGLEKVMMKLGLGQPLLPDPELGQDVAFLAFVIKGQAETLDEARRILDGFIKNTAVCQAIAAQCVGDHAEAPCPCLYCAARRVLAKM